MDYKYLYDFASNWAKLHRNASAALASAFGKWYAETYPNGDHECSWAWTYTFPGNGDPRNVWDGPTA